jgi:hypothetical protein
VKGARRNSAPGKIVTYAIARRATRSPTVGATERYKPQSARTSATAEMINPAGTYDPPRIAPRTRMSAGTKGKNPPSPSGR